VLGPVSGTVDLASAEARVLGDHDGDRTGISLAAGDVDGDGFEDVLVGAPGDDGGGLSAGAAYLVHGPVSGSTDLGAADATFVGEAAGDDAGNAVATGDVDGDGAEDVVVAASEADSGSTGSGAVYVWLGSVAGPTSLADAHVRLAGVAASDSLGEAIAVADTDGDGFADVLAGAPGLDAGLSDAGGVYLWFGPVAGTATASEADARFLGESRYDAAGSAVAAGDVDGDGFADVVVGAWYRDEGGVSAGAAYLLLGGRM
jgi:hypothetical protein